MKTRLEELPLEEQRAFLGWFRGGKSHLSVHGDDEYVFMGKYECEKVDFDEFWLDKMPRLGWFTVEITERFIAKGMIGKPPSFKCILRPTELGWKIREEYYTYN